MARKSLSALLAAAVLAALSAAHADTLIIEGIDPEGATPAWLTNRLLVGAPFETMAAMRTLLASGRYNDASVPWITEP